jgi:hypothetical protein
MSGEWVKGKVTGTFTMKGLHGVRPKFGEELEVLWGVGWRAAVDKHLEKQWPCAEPGSIEWDFELGATA